MLNPSLPEDRKLPFVTAFDRVDEAIGLSRQRDEGEVSEEEQYERYLMLRQDPRALMEFVAQALGTRNPEQIREGALAYLEEMEARYGNR
jgi:hypothetical protein